jgi:hypothetical protein
VRNRYVNTLARLRYKCRKRGVLYKLDDDPAANLALRKRFERGICELSGVRLKIGPGAQTWNSASIDRIDPSKGYVHGNVRVVAHGINAALGNWGPDRLAELVFGWLKQEAA